MLVGGWAGPLRARPAAGSPGVTPASPLDLAPLAGISTLLDHSCGLTVSIGDQLVQDIRVVEHDDSSVGGWSGVDEPWAVRQGGRTTGRSNCGGPAGSDQAGEPEAGAGDDGRLAHGRAVACLPPGRRVPFFCGDFTIVTSSRASCVRLDSYRPERGAGKRNTSGVGLGCAGGHLLPAPRRRVRRARGGRRGRRHPPRSPRRHGSARPPGGGAARLRPEQLADQSTPRWSKRWRMAVSGMPGWAPTSSSTSATRTGRPPALGDRKSPWPAGRRRRRRPARPGSPAARSSTTSSDWAAPARALLTAQLIESDVAFRWEGGCW